MIAVDQSDSSIWTWHFCLCLLQLFSQNGFKTFCQVKKNKIHLSSHTHTGWENIGISFQPNEEILAFILECVQQQRKTENQLANTGPISPYIYHLNSIRHILHRSENDNKHIESEQKKPKILFSNNFFFLFVFVFVFINNMILSTLLCVYDKCNWLLILFKDRHTNNFFFDFVLYCWWCCFWFKKIEI